MGIPVHIQAFMPLIEAVTAGMSNGGHTIRPIVMAAILDHESQAGRALNPPGPGGTGDFELRPSNRYARAEKLFKLVVREDGSRGYLPADLRGWGRGLWQLDWGAHHSWCEEVDEKGTPLWAIPAHNCRKACEIFFAALNELDGDEDAAIAAYNCGAVRVANELSQLTPVDDPADQRQSKIIALDRLTTHSYLSAILNRIDRWTPHPSPPPPPRPKGVA